MNNNLQRLKESIFEHAKRFLKEIMIALVLAMIAAIFLEYYFDYNKEKTLENNSKAIAKLFAYNSKMELIGTASGVFISSEGKLVTNYHVIEKAYSIHAKLPSGAFYVLKSVIGVSKKYDIAVLEFDAKEVPYIKIKKGIKAAIGESVFTIGSPLGLEKTVTEGIVSNPQRLNGDIELIQFTAPISSGNSGGGLFNKNGIMIGITTETLMAHNEKESAQNLNFAIPVKYVEKATKEHSVEFTENSPDWYYAQGVIHSNKKEYKEAIECLLKAINKDSNYVNAYTQLGEVDYEIGQYSAGVKVLEYAKSLLPNDPEINFSLANAYEDVARYDLAIDAYLKVLQYRPDDKDALYYLCFLYVLVGKKDEAARYAPKLKKLNYGLGTEIEILLSRTN